MPAQDGDETYAIAVTATSETPNCIALCVQTKLEELYASGIVDRSANHRPRLFVVAANDRPDEDVQGLRTALDMLRVAHPDFHIELSERTPEQAMRAALAEELRDALDACKINASQENFQRLAATMIAAPLFFPAQRPEGETARPTVSSTCSSARCAPTTGARSSAPSPTARACCSGATWAALSSA